MQTLKINDLAAFIKAISLDLNEPVMVWGPPGGGKSAIVAQVTNEVSGILVDIRLSQYDSVDLRGFPRIVNEHMAWAPPVTLPFVGNPAFPTDRPIILFLDEINSASPAVAAVAYQLINDRRVGEHVLLPNVRLIAAGNREGDKGVTNRMPLPLANRMIHVETIMDAESWVDHHLDTGGDPIFAAFFAFRPQLICTFDPASPRKSFGTYRSWTKAAKIYSSDMPQSIKNAGIAGAVGDGESAEFLGFADIAAKMPDLDTIMATPKTADLPEGVGMTYAVAVAVSGRMSVETVANADTYLKRLSPEFRVLAWQTATKRLSRETTNGGADLIRTPEGLKYAADLSQLQK